MKRPRKTSELTRLHPLESLGVVQTTSGEIRIEPLEERVVPKVPFPHRHDFFQLTIFEKASGTHSIDFRDYKISSKQAFLMKPGQAHTWKLGREAKGFVIEFTHESLSKSDSTFTLLDNLNNSSDVATLDSKDFKSLKTLCEIMRSEFLARNPRKRELLESYLSAILILLLRNTPGAESRAHLNFVGRFKELVDQRFSDEHSVEYYAKALNLSPKALTMQIKRSLDKSAKQVIHERILLESKRLLAYSNLPISDIADHVGFFDANYFARFFRAHAKTSPRAFRKRAATQR